jgi:PAS domain S-box-containing protein
MTASRTNARFAVMAALAVGLVLCTEAADALSVAASGLVAIGIAGVSLAWVITGIRRYRPEGAFWHWLALVVALDLIAALLWSSPAIFTDDERVLGSPSVADACWVASNLVLAGALLRRLLGPRGQLSVVLDVATIASGAGLLVGVLLIGPDLAASGLSGGETLNAVSFAITDIVLIAVVSRILMARHGRTIGTGLVAIAAAGVVGSDVAWNWFAISGDYAPGGWADLGWDLRAVLIGLAALHPSMRERHYARHDDLRSTGPMLLGGASLVVPLLLGSHVLIPGIPDIDGARASGIAVIVGGTVLSALVVTRFMLLLRRARRLTGAAEVALDERTRMLALSEARHRGLIEQLPAVVVMYEIVDGRSVRPVYAGGQTAAILGLGPAELADLDALMERVHPDDRAHVLDALSDLEPGDRTEPFEFRFERPDGKEIWLRDAGGTVEESGGARGLQGLLFDITDAKRAEAERNQLELELRLGQKLEAVGELAAGIAHEINTPIQFVGDTVRFLEDSFTEVMGLVEVQAELRRAAEAGQVDAALLERVRTAEELADIEYLAERVPGAFGRADDGIRRVATIVRAMREFAHPPTMERAPADLNEAVRNTLVVATNTYKYVADLEMELDDLPPVVCNVGDINQVLLNLIVNAGQAVETALGDGDARGTIRISTRRDEDHVVVSIADTGTGIRAEFAERIFDPFFTTKDVGAGTGQGLAIARTIVVERHGGSLTFESEPGQGTTFHIRLPIEPATSALPAEPVT